MDLEKDRALFLTLEKAKDLIESGELSHAQILLTKTLKSNPSSEPAWFLLSQALEEQDQKVYALRRVLQLNPDHQTAQSQLANLGQETKQSKEQPEEDESKVSQEIAEANALIEANELAAAHNLLRSILQAHPNHAQAWYLMGLAAPTLREQNNALRQALRIDPDHNRANLRLKEMQRVSAAAVPTTPQPISTPAAGYKAPNNLFALAKYMARRTIVILLTILIGVYVTILFTNKTGQIDTYVRFQIEEQLEWMRDHEFAELSQVEQDGAVVRARRELREKVGFMLPSAQRHLRWAFNSLTFNWGKMVAWNYGTAVPGSRQKELLGVNQVVLMHFPNTLLVIGTANLIIFLVGIPLALYLAARKQGHRIERFITMLSPISSIPSWVHGVLLISVFAIQLKILPYGGKYDMFPAATWYGNALIVGKHIILPVTAVLLGMFFQLVYAWRTYFLIFSEEDYVELAKARGLAPREVERRYILRPTLPYVFTSFALTLVGFWQMTTAVEHVFNWPGIGQLFISSLPQYFEEFFYPGDVPVILCVVVIFAYLLGLTVLLLDIFYAWVDPRIRLGTSGYTLSTPKRRFRLQNLFRRKRKAPKFALDLAESRPSQPRSLSKWARMVLTNWRITIRNNVASSKRVFREILRYPSAVVGLVIVSIMVIGSLVAVIALPYVEIGEQWQSSGLTGKLYVPKNVPATWVNWFRIHDLPSTITCNSEDGTIEKSTRVLENGFPEISFSMDLDYPYGGFPQDMLLYIKSTYQEKRPHIIVSWTTPDGRQFNPNSPSVNPLTTYVFSDFVRPRLYLRKNENWEKWFVTEEPKPTPPFYLLFADPEAEEPVALPGKYRLEISALGFEENTDVDIEFVLLGQVFGWAGTDYLRRDLLTPLLWGLPFTLAIGLLGATLTTVFAMIFAAAGAWFGGWVDGLFQRLTEFNMIMPVLAIGVLAYALFDVSLWTILVVVIALNVFSSPTKAFRAAFLQVKEAPYIESARAYGASHARIIFTYMIPRIIPTAIPQLVTLIPSMVFLEATLGILNVFDPRYPTWGRVIFEALTQNALWGGYDYWVLEPIALLLLVGLAFSLLGFAMERVLNPRLQVK